MNVSPAGPLGTAACLIGALLLVAPACTGGPGPGESATADPEKIVVEIDGRPIPERRLHEVIEAERLHRGAAAVAADESALETRRRALDLLIAGELLYQAALRAGLEVDQAEIDRQLEVTRSQFATDEEFRSYLADAGLDEARLREEIERRALMGAYVATVTENLTVDEAEARRIYERGNPVDAVAGETRAAQILVRVRPGDTAEKREAARRKIEEAHRRAVAGEDFSELAREYSESPLAARGGDLGFVSRGRLIASLEKIVFNTPVGEISPVFETPHGLNVIKVLDRREAATKGFDAVKTGLLMVLAREQQDRRLRGHVAELRSRSQIRILDPELAAASESRN